MKILLGTTNPSKAKRFAALLADYEVEFVTLQDLRLLGAPEETGRTPVENAEIKARYYGQFFDHVLCADSGLYLLELPMDDPRQPGLHIRSPKGFPLGDEEMIAYYATLVHTLGGRCPCVYVDGYAAFHDGTVRTFLDQREDGAFFLVDAVHPRRHPGWPLDSISVDPSTGLYFVDPDQKALHPSIDAVAQVYRARLTAFLAETFQLKRREP